MRAVALLIPLLALAACSQAPQQDSAGGASPASDAARPAPLPPATPPAAGPDTSVQSPAPGAPTDGAGLARVDGYGDLRFGMSEAEVRKAWPGELKGDAVEPDNCAYLRPASDEEFRIGFMFERGVLVRYDVDIESETAPGGGRVGQTKADIGRLYAGRVQVQPHEYVPGGNYLRVTDPGIQGGALVFETDEAGKVTRWRVGRAPQVDYVEGCA